MRLKFKQLTRVLGIICIGLILFFETAASAGAAESSPSDNTGETPDTSMLLLPAEALTGELSKLTVHLEFTDDALEKVVPVPGTTIDLYKVADLYIEDGNVQYVPVEPFTSLPVNYEGIYF